MKKFLEREIIELRLKYYKMRVKLLEREKLQLMSKLKYGGEK